MKKLGSLLLALSMVFCLSISAFAETELYSGGGKMTVYPDEEKKIEFIGSFSGPFYVAFSDQGQVVWSGLEVGVKDFSFNLEPIPSIIEKHPDVQFINFIGTPSFIETATVQFTIPVNDAVNPTLYMVDEDGTIVKVPDVRIVGSSNKKFEFKVNELAKTYIISSVSLDYEEGTPIKDTTIPEPEPEPEVPVVENPEPTVEEPTEPAPQTGVEDAPYMLMVLVGTVGLVGVMMAKKKD